MYLCDCPFSHQYNVINELDKTCLWDSTPQSWCVCVCACVCVCVHTSHRCVCVHAHTRVCVHACVCVPSVHSECVPSVYVCVHAMCVCCVICACLVCVCVCCMYMCMWTNNPCYNLDNTQWRYIPSDCKKTDKTRLQGDRRSQNWPYNEVACEENTEREP